MAHNGAGQGSSINTADAQCHVRAQACCAAGGCAAARAPAAAEATCAMREAAAAAAARDEARRGPAGAIFWYLAFFKARLASSCCRLLSASSLARCGIWSASSRARFWAMRAARCLSASVSSSCPSSASAMAQIGRVRRGDALMYDGCGRILLVH